MADEENDTGGDSGGDGGIDDSPTNALDEGAALGDADDEIMDALNRLKGEFDLLKQVVDKLDAKIDTATRKSKKRIKDAFKTIVDVQKEVTGFNVNVAKLETKIKATAFGPISGKVAVVPQTPPNVPLMPMTGGAAVVPPEPTKTNIDSEPTNNALMMLPSEYSEHLFGVLESLPTCQTFLSMLSESNSRSPLCDILYEFTRLVNQAPHVTQTVATTMETVLKKIAKGKTETQRAIASIEFDELFYAVFSPAVLETHLNEVTDLLLSRLSSSSQPTVWHELFSIAGEIKLDRKLEMFAVDATVMTYWYKTRLALVVCKAMLTGSQPILTQCGIEQQIVNVAFPPNVHTNVVYVKRTAPTLLDHVVCNPYVTIPGSYINAVIAGKDQLATFPLAEDCFGLGGPNINLGNVLVTFFNSAVRLPETMFQLPAERLKAALLTQHPSLPHEHTEYYAQALCNFESSLCPFEKHYSTLRDVHSFFSCIISNDVIQARKIIRHVCARVGNLSGGTNAATGVLNLESATTACVSQWFRLVLSFTVGLALTKSQITDELSGACTVFDTGLFFTLTSNALFIAS